MLIIKNILNNHYQRKSLVKRPVYYKVISKCGVWPYLLLLIETEDNVGIERRSISWSHCIIKNGKRFVTTFKIGVQNQADIL